MFLQTLANSHRITRRYFTEDRTCFVKRLQNLCIQLCYKDLYLPLDMEIWQLYKLKPDSLR